MPRACRSSQPGYVYHLIVRGNNKQVIFREHKDFQKYLYLLEEARKRFSVLIYNYVLMSNHAHLLVGPQAEGANSKFMEYVGKCYAQYFNDKYEHVGHVFQGRYKTFTILDAWYFFACTRYIDRNPIKAGIVSDPAYYIWSGHVALISGRQGIVQLDFHDLYRNLAEDDISRREAYRVLVNSGWYSDLDLLNRRDGMLKNKSKKVAR